MDLTWRKSARSNANGGACVEVARAAGMIAARDSKSPDGGLLWFTSAEWRAFAAAVKAGALDLHGDG